MGNFIDGEAYFTDKDLTYLKDNLTGLLNREAVIDYVNYLIDEKRPFAYMMCDIDNFKFVNDTLGHKIGDAVIKKAAEGLVEFTKHEGIVGRFGGDEFLVVIPDVEEYDAIWKICRKIVFESNHLVIEELNGNNISFTVGLSRFPFDADNYEVLMEKADKALYRGKQKGRNCFIIYLHEKHADIKISDSGAKAFNSMDMHAKVARILTSSPDLKSNINNLLYFLSGTMMFDNLCIQSMDKMFDMVIHPLSNSKDFKYIDNDILLKTTNASGYCFINNILTLVELNFIDTYNKFCEQGVTGSLFVKIEAYNNFYGYLRADTSKQDGRIWQAIDIDILIMFATMLGTILYNQGKTLEDL